MSRHAAARTAFLALAVTTTFGVSVAEAQPDFTGLWETYRAASQGRASGFGGPRAALPLTEEGRRRVDEPLQRRGGPRIDLKLVIGA